MPIAAVLCMFSIVYGGFVAFYAKVQVRHRVFQLEPMGYVF